MEPTPCNKCGKPATSFLPKIMYGQPNEFVFVCLDCKKVVTEQRIAEIAKRRDELIAKKAPQLFNHPNVVDLRTAEGRHSAEAQLKSSDQSGPKQTNEQDNTR